MAFTGAFRSPQVKGMARDIQGYKLQDLMGLISGKKSPWDSPMWGPQIQGMRTQGDIGLGELSKRLTEGGVTGPAAGLALERAGEGIGGNVLNLANMMKQGIGQEAGQAGDFWLRMKQMQNQMVQARQQQEAQEKQAQMSNLMNILPKLAAVGAAPFTGGLSLGGLFAGGGGLGATTGMSNLLSSNWQNLPPEMLKALGS